MKVGSLFSGIGGFDLGLEWAGMEVVWQVENDPFCLKVLNKHWPEVPKYGDIKELNAENLAKVDVIAGGFPCQSFSTAGKRRGTDDDRYLWPEMLRIIQELRPTWVIGENVTGIVRLALDTVLSNLEEEGYSTRTFNIPACGLNAPHRRERVWIVAHSGYNAGESQRQCEQEVSEESRPSGEGQLHAQNVAYSKKCDDRRRPRKVQDKDEQQTQKRQEEWSTELSCSGKDVADPKYCGFFRKRVPKITTEGIFESARSSTGITGHKPSVQWTIEPDVGRVVNGIPNRVDRLKGLGNAVVPQIPYIFGCYIQGLNSSASQQENNQ